MQGFSKMLDKASGRKMNISIEMREAIVFLAGPRGWHENRKGWLCKAARVAGISYRQAKSLFYGEARNPNSHVVERVREAARCRQKEILREARHAYSELTQSIQRAESALRVSDEDFHSPQIAALREILGGANRSVGRRK
jgi:hypothetical protein